MEPGKETLYFSDVWMVRDRTGECKIGVYARPARDGDGYFVSVEGMTAYITEETMACILNGETVKIHI